MGFKSCCVNIYSVTFYRRALAVILRGWRLRELRCQLGPRVEILCWKSKSSPVEGKGEVTQGPSCASVECKHLPLGVLELCSSGGVVGGIQQVYAMIALCILVKEVDIFPPLLR